ncbi:MAG: hypothetical protein OES57_02610 [Acidimicrobiia bacterium]|nr:hypothetical protein [Acidimicrobiia bacterium]
MKETPRNLWRLLALLFAFTLLAAACGSDDDGDSGSDDAADEADGGSDDAADDAEAGDADDGGDTADGGEAAAFDFSGVDITVGSKDFTEQIVMGEILVQALEEYGATVNNQVNLGGTVVNREALLAGEIDTYWEYNGTGWTVHLEQEEPSFDAETLTADVAEKDLADNGIQWIGRSPFNDTYGFAASPALAEENGEFDLQAMADYLAANPDAVLCLETEFPNRPDGLILFEEATGYTVPESQVNILETGVIYTETGDGNCDFGEIFTTDGRIASLGLSLVEDPGVFIIYNLSLTMPDELYQANQADWDALVEAILAPLDEETMTELNRRVSDGEDAAAVAADYLGTIGLVMEG